jgi:hypothetical protein
LHHFLGPLLVQVVEYEMFKLQELAQMLWLELLVIVLGI